MIQAIAIDDEPPAIRVIEAFCQKSDDITLIKTFHIPNEGLKYIKQYPVDLVFLDINMPSVTGLEIQKILPPEVMVIFTTAYSEYAVEGFNVNAIDYLLKPITHKRFQQALQKAKDAYAFRKQAPTEENWITIRADYRLVKINLNDILYIEGLDDYLKIHLQDQKPLIARMTLKGILEKLPPQEFIRTHRSYIVPIKKIESFTHRSIRIAGNEIPISQSYEEDFLKLFNKN